MSSRDQVERFLAGLRQHESGNRNVNNPNTSASGYYQYVDGTWNNYKGYRRAVDAPFAVQHERARRDALRNFDRYGSWDKVAAHHFYPAWANSPSKWDQRPGHSSNPTVRQFVSSVLGKMPNQGSLPPASRGSGTSQPGPISEGGSSTTRSTSNTPDQIRKSTEEALKKAAIVRSLQGRVRDSDLLRSMTAARENAASAILSTRPARAQEGAAMPQMTFFDPIMAELQRRLSLQVQQGVADLDLRSQRLTEDRELLLGSPDAPGRFRRQMARDARSTASGVAGRGFHGANSGIMRKAMGELGQDQTDALSGLHRMYSREQEDIQREMARLQQHGAIEGAEGTRKGAGRASSSLVQRLPF